MDVVILSPAARYALGKSLRIAHDHLAIVNRGRLATTPLDSGTYGCSVVLVISSVVTPIDPRDRPLARRYYHIF